MNNNLSQSLHLFLTQPCLEHKKILSEKLQKLGLFLNQEVSDELIHLSESLKKQRILCYAHLLCYPALLGFLIYGFEKLEPRVWLGVFAFVSTALLLKLTHHLSQQHQQHTRHYLDKEINFRAMINDQMRAWSRNLNRNDITPPTEPAEFKRKALCI